MEIMSFLIVAVLVVLFLMVIRSPTKYMQLLGAIFVRFVIGGFLIFAVNIIGTQFNFHLPLNLYTAGITGLLGIPGVVALSVINIMFIK